MVYKVFFNDLQEIEKISVEEESNTRYAFNIFSILRKDDDEVGLHSKFLAELLNPYASHNIPDFQRLFIEKVINPAIEVQEWQREFLDSNVLYNCQTEVLIEGFGRVDIILESSDNIIVIENKIHAADQKKQLQRYFEACLKMGYPPDAIYILYLNKVGIPVTSYGKGTLRDDQYGRINYKDDISSWLDVCVSEVSDYPHIKQTLLQYGRLVSSLTGDNRSAKMKKSHIDLLYQDNNFKLAHELSQSLNSFQIDLQKNVWQEMLFAFGQRGYRFKFCDKELQGCDQNIKVKNYYKNESKENRFYGIHYEIGNLEGYSIHCFIQLNHNIYYGMTVSSNKIRLQYPDKLVNLANQISRLNNHGRDSDTRWFLGINILPNVPVNFKTASSIYKLIGQESRSKWISQTVDEIVLFIEKVKELELIEVQ